MLLQIQIWEISPTKRQKLLSMLANLVKIYQKPAKRLTIYQTTRIENLYFFRLKLLWFRFEVQDTRSK
jgi:hypothetical protein